MGCFQKRNFGQGQGGRNFESGGIVNYFEEFKTSPTQKLMRRRRIGRKNFLETAPRTIASPGLSYCHSPCNSLRSSSHGPLKLRLAD